MRRTPPPDKKGTNTMSFQIISDSCFDYPYLADDISWIKRVPLYIELDGEVFTDNENLRCTGLITKMAASSSAPKSSCASPGNFLEAFECGADDVYVITLSDKVSGSYASAIVAANMFKEKYPDRNIFVFSSRSAAAGQVALGEKLYELASSGMPFAEVMRHGLKFVDEMSTYFVLENLDVFRKNGRLSHLQSIVTGALRIKLVMGADSSGNVCVRGKALSTDGAISKMIDMIAARISPAEAKTRKLYISHCQCPERARLVRDSILKKVPFKDSLILRTGGISTIYANDGGFVLAY